MGLLQAVVVALTMLVIVIAWQLTLELEVLEDVAAADLGST